MLPVPPELVEGQANQALASKYIHSDQQRDRLGALLLAAAVMAVPIAFWLWRRSLDTSFFAVSGDDFQRTFYAWQVTQGWLVPSDLWPPLQFWIEALAMLVYPHTLVVPMLVNLAASTGALAALLLLGRALGIGRAAALLQLVLIATLPWFVWLSLSALAEPLFFCGIVLAYLGVARWRAAGRERWLWLAAIGLLAAGMLRFDGWGHSLVFSLGVGWLCWRAPRPRPWRWLAAAALPWLCPLIWLAYQYVGYGNLFHFSKVTQNYYLVTFGRLPLAQRLLWQPSDLWAVAGMTLPLALIGLWLIRQRPGVVLLTLMWLASFALLIQSTWSHTITQNNPQRLVVIHALLLTPGVALALQALFRRGILGAALALALSLALIAPRISAIPSYPNGLANDSMLVGRHLTSLREQATLQPGDKVMIEVLFWDYVILRILADDPGAVVYDRPPILVLKPGGEHTLDDQKNPSLLALPPEQLRAELKRRGVRVVVAYSKRAIANLVPIAQETFQAQRFHVFVVE